MTINVQFSFKIFKVIVTALITAIPSILNVLLVCVLFWLIFAIMGVQLFAGQFYKCIFPDNSSLVPYDIVKNKTDCLSHNYTWINSRVNFDDVLNSYFALLQLATFEGWTDIIADATDINGVFAMNLK